MPSPVQLIPSSFKAGSLATLYPVNYPFTRAEMPIVSALLLIAKNSVFSVLFVSPLALVQKPAFGTFALGLALPR